jgi:Flp pilus assembly protein TadD
MSQIDDLVSKGKSFLEEGNFDSALGCFDQAIILNQNDPDLWNLKGVTLRSLGRYTEALECFNKSLEIEPRDKFAS